MARTVAQSLSFVSLVVLLRFAGALRAPVPTRVPSATSDTKPPTGIGGFRFGLKPPPPPPTPPPPQPLPTSSPVEAAVQRACAVGWLALTPVALVKSDAAVHTIFGLASETFEDQLREPAGGFLEITSSLFPLEAALLFALASGSLITADRVRAGGSLALTSALTLGGLGIAALDPAFWEMEPAVPALLAIGVLVAGSGSVGARAVFAEVDEVSPLSLFSADAAAILPAREADAEDLGGLVSLFYQASVLTGILVGASFIFSPISPINLFESEAPATHFLRECLGIYIVALLAPVQAVLLQEARNGVLGTPDAKALNAVTGLCCLLLVCDGKFQVAQSTAGFESLEKGTAFYEAVTAQLGDPAAVGRASTNTTAAFSVGLIVALVYVFQALTARKPSTQ